MIVSNIFTSTLHSARLFKITKAPFKIGDWVIKPLLFTSLGGFLGLKIAGSIKGDLAFLVVQASVHIAVFCLGEYVFSRKTFAKK